MLTNSFYIILPIFARYLPIFLDKRRFFIYNTCNCGYCTEITAVGARNCLLAALEDLKMYEELKDLLVSELLIDEADIKPESELVADLGISSVDLADLVCQCEDKFGIEIDDTDMSKFVTVRDIVNYLEEKKAEKNG